MNTITLLEGGTARGTGKRRRAKLISANVWGSSAYYPADVLERDAPLAFPVGTHMYENHFTDDETMSRPEGDVTKLIGKLVSNGVYESDNPEGPGVYADVEFYDSYVSRINEIGDDVGLSVHGSGDYVEGERDGRFGRIITRVENVRSVDVVTKAGAGGKLVTILESARNTAGIPIETEGARPMADLTKEDFEAGLTNLATTLSASLSTAIKESLAEQPEPEKEPVQTEPVTPVEPAEEKEPVEIDHAALLTAINGADLPSDVIPAVVKDVQEGETVEKAIEKQTKLREAFVQHESNSQVIIKEAGGEAPVSRRDAVLGIFNGNKN